MRAFDSRYYLTGNVIAFEVNIDANSSPLFTLDSIMADDEMNLVLQDLQKQLQNAKIPVGNLSTIAKKGDDAVSIIYNACLDLDVVKQI